MALAGGGQVDGRTHRGHGGGGGCGAVAGLLRPAQQRVAAQRDAHHQQRRAAALAQALQHPADLLEIARVVGARRQVHLTRAAAKVRHAVGPAALARHGGKGLRVLAGAAALQAVEEHQVLRWRRRIGRALQVVDIDKVAVGRGPALAREDRRRAEVAACAVWPPRWSAGCRPAARPGPGSCARAPVSVQRGRRFAVVAQGLLKAQALRQAGAGVVARRCASPTAVLT